MVLSCSDETLHKVPAGSFLLYLELKKPKLKVFWFRTSEKLKRLQKMFFKRKYCKEM